MLHFIGNQPHPFLVGLPSTNTNYRVSIGAEMQDGAKDENYD